MWKDICKPQDYLLHWNQTAVRKREIKLYTFWIWLVINEKVISQYLSTFQPALDIITFINDFPSKN